MAGYLWPADALCQRIGHTETDFGLRCKGPYIWGSGARQGTHEKMQKRPEARGRCCSNIREELGTCCLLYTSDAADD